MSIYFLFFPIFGSLFFFLNTQWCYSFIHKSTRISCTEVVTVNEYAIVYLYLCFLLRIMYVKKIYLAFTLWIFENSLAYSMCYHINKLQCSRISTTDWITTKICLLIRIVSPNLAMVCRLDSLQFRFFWRGMVITSQVNFSVLSFLSRTKLYRQCIVYISFEGLVSFCRLQVGCRLKNRF